MRRGAYRWDKHTAAGTAARATSDQTMQMREEERCTFLADGRKAGSPSAEAAGATLRD
jgi:hypothetical protein